MKLIGKGLDLNKMSKESALPMHKADHYKTLVADRESDFAQPPPGWPARKSSSTLKFNQSQMFDNKK
jgi:hypothetical protein